MENNVVIYDNPLMKNLQQGITTTGSFEVKRIDKLGINLELKKYKENSGAINFAAIRDIPVEQRIYSLAKKDLGETVKLIAVAITLAMESVNVTRPMNAFQILDLSEAIVEESSSDNLSIQDVLLFLQRLTRGYYPGLFEGMDSVKFFERFNHYRDERFEEMKALRDQKIDELQRLGDTNERANKKDGSTFGMQMEHYRQKIQARNDERKSRKQ